MFWLESDKQVILIAFLLLTHLNCRQVCLCAEISSISELDAHLVKDVLEHLISRIHDKLMVNFCYACPVCFLN